ncbi:MAG: ThuA domain-containing protein [Chthoniobacterales bacterium]|nr:ThuA domain-containing protein [Chthoniobacterales bacterium]
MKIRYLTIGLIVAATSLHAAEAPKRVLVCTVTAGFRHPSIPFGEEALADLDKASPDFEIVEWIRQPDINVPQPPRAPRKPAGDASPMDNQKYNEALALHEKKMAAWQREGKQEADRKQTELNEAMKQALGPLSPQALRDNRIDAVVFCNTSGPLPLPDIEGFAEWVRSGGAFIGIHAGSDTLKDALPYTEMLCGSFESHGPQVPATLHAGDKDHPANGKIGDIWTLSQEEMYLIKNHNRDLVRSIWFMRHHPNKPEEKGFYPVAWVRSFGNGRVFYTSLGHREDMWSIDPDLPNRINPVETAQQFRSHLLGGMRWALGLDPGSSDPNPQTN